MYTLRCTRKLLRRIDEAPSSEAVASTTVLGDWCANLLYLRPQQLVLAMNERSLLCVLVPAAPAATVAERLRLEVGGALRRGIKTGGNAKTIAMEFVLAVLAGALVFGLFVLGVNVTGFSLPERGGEVLVAVVAAIGGLFGTKLLARE